MMGLHFPFWSILEPWASEKVHGDAAPVHIWNNISISPLIISPTYALFPGFLNWCGNFSFRNLRITNILSQFPGYPVISCSNMLPVYNHRNRYNHQWIQRLQVHVPDKMEFHFVMVKKMKIGWAIIKPS